MSMFPPNLPGGTTNWALAPAGHTPMVPELRYKQYSDVVAQVRDVAV